MKYNKGKIIKISVIFFIIMLFFTVISTKVDYMMTPQVATTRTTKANLQININTNATVTNGLVTFNLNMEKESLLHIGDSVQVEFVNGKYEKKASVIEKKFNPDYQTMEYICELSESGTNVHEGQIGEIRFDYSLGTFDMILPRECVIYEGQKPFIYYIENVNTVTGEKYIVKKAEINILEEDDFYVAVSGNITERNMVVQYSSKPIQEGAKVRVGI